jgi:fructose-1-phosphate kinase PfkB-like protein
MNHPAPFITLTGNLLWERTLTFHDWAPGHTQRASAETFQVGGKGVNVSRMLTRLGCPSTALIFTGGATGADCETWLKAQALDFRAFPADRATRIGVVVRGGGRPETTFLGPDEAPGAAAVRACAEFLDAQPGGVALAVCGSLPGWASPGFEPLRAAFERWLARGLIAVDTYGPPLAWFVERPVPLIKINRMEFDSLFTAAERDDDIAVRLRRLRTSRPVRAWVVTDGPGPVWWIDEQGEPASLAPPPIREISATGSGDVLFAGLLHALRNLGFPLRDAVAFALPYAAAKAADIASFQNR